MFVYLIFRSQIVLYFLQSISVLLFHVNLVITLSTGQCCQCLSVGKYDIEYKPRLASLLELAAASWCSCPSMTDYAKALDPKNSSLLPQNKFDPVSGTLLCSRFKSPIACKLRRCKFAHVCCVCYKAHSITSHGDQATMVTNTTEPK